MYLNKMMAALRGENQVLTNTGLDLLAINTLTVDMTFAVVEALYRRDLIPATAIEAGETFQELTGLLPHEIQLSWLREELDSFGWWAENMPA